MGAARHSDNTARELGGHSHMVYWGNQGTPVIVSDSSLLQRALDSGATHVDNSVEAIVAAVPDVPFRTADRTHHVHCVRQGSPAPAEAGVWNSVTT